MNTKSNQLVVVFAVIVAIAAALYFSVVGKAGTSQSVAICDTIDENTNAAYNGHNVDSSDANSRHCETTAKVYNPQPIKKHHKQNKTTVTTVTTVTVIIDNGGATISTDNGGTNTDNTKSCHNKNSGKDGTPNECNAGKGQEKHNK